MSSAALRLDHHGAESFADELPVGTQLLQGQFTIESFLNAGGFGITYVARDSLNRQVVIKECFPSSFCRRAGQRVAARSQQRDADLNSMVSLFVQEAINLSTLDHPNIVKVHQVFQDNGTAYMVMDYIRGPDLLETIEGTAPRLSPDRIVRLLVSMLDALGHVHSRGFLHRDVSPDNILLDAGTGEPVLIDFGAARKDETRKSRAISGLRVVKDGYSPQEFYISGSVQAPCSDLYALAASFSHLITGEAPKTSRERLSAIANRQADPQQPLLGRVKGYPDRFLAAIDKAMSIFPRDRLQSVAEWQAVIASASPVDPAVAAAAMAPMAPKAPPAAVQAQPLPPQRDRLVRAAAIVVLLAGLASLAGEIYDRFWAPQRDAKLLTEGALTLGSSGGLEPSNSDDSSHRTGFGIPDRIGLGQVKRPVPAVGPFAMSGAEEAPLSGNQGALGSGTLFQSMGLDRGSAFGPPGLSGLGGDAPGLLLAGLCPENCFRDKDLSVIHQECDAGRALPDALALASGSAGLTLADHTDSAASMVVWTSPGQGQARLPEDEVNNDVATCDFAVQPSGVASLGACFRTAATYRGAWYSQDGLEKLT